MRHRKWKSVDDGLDFVLHQTEDLLGVRDELGGTIFGNTVRVNTRWSFLVVTVFAFGVAAGTIRISGCTPCGVQPS